MSNDCIHIRLSYESKTFVRVLHWLTYFRQTRKTGISGEINKIEFTSAKAKNISLQGLSMDYDVAGSNADNTGME